MIILLWILFALAPLCVGKALLTGWGKLPILREKEWVSQGMRKTPEATESWLVGSLVCLGIGEGVHLLFIFGDIGLMGACMVFAGLCGVAVLLSAAVLIWSKMGSDVSDQKSKDKLKGEPVIALLFFAVIFVASLYLFCRQGRILTGEITPETVLTILSTKKGAAYSPLNGQAFGIQIPFRQRILGLPTIYALLCEIFGTKPLLLVENIVPITVLAASLMAYDRLGKLFFGNDADKRFTFLICVVILYAMGESAPFLDGYGIFHGGYSGYAIRNTVLFPLTIEACLVKNLPRLVLCILAEASIVWTLWGMGLCLETAICMAALYLLLRLWRRMRGEVRV